MARPTWMSGDVTSIPSLTRSGRPSFSLSSSAPRGSTSTAFRVRSAIDISASLVRDRLEVLYPNLLDVVRGPEAEDLRHERQRHFERAAFCRSTAEAVTLAFERDVGVRDAVLLERRGDCLGLRGRDDLVVEALQQQERLRDVVCVRHG